MRDWILSLQLEADNENSDDEDDEDDDDTDVADDFETERSIRSPYNNCSTTTGAVTDNRSPSHSPFASSDANHPTAANTIYDETLMAALIQELGANIGEVTLVRYVGNHMWITFRAGQSALAAARQRHIQCCGQRLRVRLRTRDWLREVRDEIQMCTANTVPLCEHQDGVDDDDVEEDEEEVLEYGVGDGAETSSAFGIDLGGVATEGSGRLGDVATAGETVTLRSFCCRAMANVFDI